MGLPTHRYCHFGAALPPLKWHFRHVGLPTFLKFQRRQYVMRAMLRAILDRVLLEARHAGRLRDGIDTHYEILFPEIDVADHQTLASATQLLVSALIAAKAQGWVSDETAMRLIFQFAGEELDIHEEQARIGKEPSPCPPTSTPNPSQPPEQAPRH